MSIYDRRRDRGSSPEDLVFNALLTNALYDYLERQGRMLEELCAGEAGQAPVEVRKRADGSYRIGRTVRGAAALLLACTLLFGTLMGTVEAFRVKVYNTYISIVGGSSELITKSQSGVSQVGAYFPEYIPKGFKLTSSDTIDGITTIQYTSNRNWIIFVQQVRIGTNYHNVGLETANPHIQINGYSGYITTVKGETSLFWYTEDMIFELSSNLDGLEVIKIAESVAIN